MSASDHDGMKAAGTGGSGNRGFLSPQDNILNCPICMDVYKTPRMLPCQHTLCDSCLKAYLVNKNMSRLLVMDFPCPVCRASTPAPKTYKPLEEWAGLFPLNHLLVSLLDSRCRPQPQVTNTPAPKQDPEEKDTCPHHPGKEIDFYCTDHDLAICSKCFKNTHRHCNVNDIEDQIEFQQRYSVVTSDIDNVLEYLKEAIESVETNISELSDQKNMYLTKVQDFVDRIESFLQRFRQDASEKVLTNHDLGVANLQEQCGRLERIREAVTLTERSLKEAQSSGNMVQSLKDLSRAETEMKTRVSTLQLNHAEVNYIRLEFKLCGKLDPFLSSLEQLSKPKVDVIRTVPNIQQPPALTAITPQDSGKEAHTVNSPHTNQSNQGRLHRINAGHDLTSEQAQSEQANNNGSQGRETMAKQSKAPETTNNGIASSQSGGRNGFSAGRARAVSDASIDYIVQAEDVPEPVIDNEERTESAARQRFDMRLTRQLSHPLLERDESMPTASERSTTQNFQRTQESGIRGPKPLSERRALKVGDIQARITGDTKECNITGSSSMSDGKLVLVDCNNCKIKLFSKEFRFQSSLVLEKEPWNVVATSSNELAVTVPLEKVIHIIRIQGNVMTDVRRLDTRKECWGIAHMDGKLVVTAKDDGSWVLFLDKSGRELVVINFASYENSGILRPVSVTVSTSGQSPCLYVACEGQTGTKGSLVALSASGEIRHTYTHWSLDKPYSSSVDKDGNVYVLGMRSSNIHLVSPSGEKLKVLLATADGVSRPQHIRFLTGTNTFLLTQRRMDTCSVYEMK